MSYKAVGRVLLVGQPLQITDKFSKRDFHVEVSENGRVSQLFLFLTNNNMALGDQFPVGSYVEVDFDISCRQFTAKDGRVFNNVELRAWRVQPYVPQQQPAYQQFQQPMPQQYAQPVPQPMPQYAPPQAMPQQQAVPQQTVPQPTPLDQQLAQTVAIRHGQMPAPQQVSQAGQAPVNPQTDDLPF